MQENQLFEYAVIRVVPKVEREEFINVGVILYARQLKFLGMIYKLEEQRLRHFNADLDITEIGAHLEAFERICNGAPNAGPIGKLDPASRFRWLTATRSTVVQTSKVHPGLCTDAGKALNRLYDQLVMT
jgi:hypothetical protein